MVNNIYYWLILMFISSKNYFPQGLKTWPMDCDFCHYFPLEATFLTCRLFIFPENEIFQSSEQNCTVWYHMMYLLNEYRCTARHICTLGKHNQWGRWCYSDTTPGRALRSILFLWSKMPFRGALLLWGRAIWSTSSKDTAWSLLFLSPFQWVVLREEQLGDSPCTDATYQLQFLLALPPGWLRESHDLAQGDKHAWPPEKLS